MISDVLASILRSGRQEFNRQFAEARRLRPDLDPGTFQEFLGTTVDGFALAGQQLSVEQVTGVITAAYEIGLELVGQKLAGPGARDRAIEEGWKRVLFPIMPLVASAPGRLLSAVSNAVHNLRNVPGARAEEWIVGLERFGPKCKDADTFLRLGQVAAWKAGLAHFRKGAIAAADGLPAEMTLAVLGASASNEWAEIRKGLVASPWYDPAQAKTKTDKTKNTPVYAGTFRGFGGLFMQPPSVANGGEHFLVRSAEECWLLTADLYGATFHRANMNELQSVHSPLSADLRIDRGQIVWKDRRFEIPALGKCTSAAANETTLALTTELTHSVMLIALT